MVLPEYNAVFVHIPKTAGQSIENFLLHSLNKNRIEHGASHLLMQNNNPDKGPKRLAHLTYSQYQSLSYLSKYRLEAPYSFAFVRNPWCRVVSFYKYSGFSKLVSFKDFAILYLPILYKQAHWFYRPQAHFVCNSQKQIAVSFLGKFEYLNTDFETVAKQLKLPFNKLPKDNASKGINLFSLKILNLVIKHPSVLRNLSFGTKDSNAFRDYYCEASRAMVEQLYADDIKLFDYSF